MNILKTFISILFLSLTSAISHGQEVSNTTNTNHSPILKVGNDLAGFSLKDQFGIEGRITTDTKLLILALTEEPAHAVNDYLKTKPSDFLSDNHYLYIADISAAPSLVRKLFIIPGLKKLDFSVLIFTDEDRAEPFREGMEVDKVIIVRLDDYKIIELITQESIKENVKKQLE